MQNNRTPAYRLDAQQGIALLRRGAACCAPAWRDARVKTRHKKGLAVVPFDAARAQYKSRVSILCPESPSCSTSICSGRSNTLPGSNFLMKMRNPPNATPKATAMTINKPVPTKIRYSTTAQGGSVAVWLGSFQVTCVMAVAFGVAFGGFRIFIKKLLPG